MNKQYFQVILLKDMARSSVPRLPPSLGHVKPQKPLICGPSSVCRRPHWAGSGRAALMTMMVCWQSKFGNARCGRTEHAGSDFFFSLPPFCESCELQNGGPWCCHCFRIAGTKERRAGGACAARATCMQGLCAATKLAGGGRRKEEY